MSEVTEEATTPEAAPVTWRDREPANVYEAIARVMADLPAIGKDAKADPAQGGYAYRGVEAITAQIQGLLARYGLVPVAEVVGPPVIDHITVNNKPWTDTTLRVRYRFVHGPSIPIGFDWIEKMGAEQLPPWCQFAAGGPDGFVGIGRDNSDKGANKAMTQCYKVCLIQTFVVGDKASDADQGSPGADAGAEQIPPWQQLGYDSDEHYDTTRQEVLGAWSALPPVAADSARAWLRDAGHPRKWPLPLDLASGLLEIARAEGERAASDTTGEESLPSEAPVAVARGSVRQPAEAAYCIRCGEHPATLSGFCVVCEAQIADEEARAPAGAPDVSTGPPEASPGPSGVYFPLEDTAGSEASPGPVQMPAVDEHGFFAPAAGHVVEDDLAGLSKGQIMLRLRDAGITVKGTEKTEALRAKLRAVVAGA